MYSLLHKGFRWVLIFLYREVQVLEDPDIKRWHEAAKNETEVIQVEEVGIQ